MEGKRGGGLMCEAGSGALVGRALGLKVNVIHDWTVQLECVADCSISSQC